MSRVPVLTANDCKDIKLQFLSLDPFNVRQEYNLSKTYTPEQKAELTELGNSMKTIGQQQPIVVRKNGAGYIVDKGERRFRAAKLTRIPALKCILAGALKDADDDIERSAQQFAENSNRKDLDIIDHGFYFNKLEADYQLDDNKKMTSKEMSELLKGYGLDFSEAYIRNAKRLTSLPDWAISLFKSKKLLSIRHLNALLIAAKSPNVLKDVKAEIDRNLKRDAADLDEDPYTASELQDDIYSAFRKHHPEVGGTSERDPVYNTKGLDKKTQDELNIVSVSSSYCDDEFILNTNKHQELQKAAKESQKKGGKSGDANKASGTGTGNKSTAGTGTGKSTQAKKNKKPNVKASSEDRLRAWFHKYLGAWNGKKISAQADYNKFLVWLALNSPSSWTYGYMSDTNVVRDLLSDYQKKHKLKSLSDVFLRDLEFNKQVKELVDFVVQGINFKSSVQLAHYLGFDISKDVLTDVDYMAMYTAAGCELFATTAKLDKLAHDKVKGGKVWQLCKKTSEKRKFCSDNAEAIGTTPELKALWTKESPKNGNKASK